MSRKHVVISGTGRIGTTFLIQLLTNLGLETGFTPQNMTVSENSRAGLEYDIRNENAPYIVKNPWFCDYAEEVLKQDDIFIEHVFIPMRELHAAAESRRYVVKKALSKMSILKRFRKKPSKISGGLWHTNSKSAQEKI